MNSVYFLLLQTSGLYNFRSTACSV